MAYFPIPKKRSVFSLACFTSSSVGSQGFGYIGYVLWYVGARQVESSGGEIWCIRFNHDTVQWDGCYRTPEVVGTAFITNPSGDADVKSHGNEFFGHLTVSGETMDY